MSKEPKSLVFGDASPKIEQLKQRDASAPVTVHLTPKPLDLSNVSTPHKAAVPNPGALFVDNTRPNSTLQAATTSARTKFASLGTSLDSVERQIKQLVPLTITAVVSWGEPGVSEESALLSKAASMIKMFSQMNGNELVEEALKAATNTKKQSFWSLGGTTNILGYKPNLIALKTQIISLLPQVDEYVEKLEKSHLRVSINVAALSSVCDAVGTISDSSLSIAVDNRRRILTQCVQQCDLTVQQLKQAKNVMVDQLSRSSQMLDVTIPAFENAQATK